MCIVAHVHMPGCVHVVYKLMRAVCTCVSHPAPIHVRAIISVYERVRESSCTHMYGCVRVSFREGIHVRERGVHVRVENIYKNVSGVRTISYENGDGGV